MSNISVLSRPLPAQPPARRHAIPTLARDPVRLWLWALAALVILMVAVGGATRLTGSGLSITEWRPVTGAVPPLSEAAWAIEFAKYQASSQYELLNRGMSLAEFKSIYWWEWAHRQLGRLIGLAFFAPLLWFWARGRIGHHLGLTLVGLGAFGALQGVVGWIMVASGLEPGMTAVAPVKLAAHLLIASLILVALAWIATGLSPAAPPLQGADPAPRRSAAVLLLLLLAQIGLGGLVAGSKAGLTYNTWPLIDGDLIPPASALLIVKPWFENLVNNPLTVQFNHRMVAYLVLALALWQAWRAARAAPGSAPSRRAGLIAGLALAQMGLGIATLVLVVPLWAALPHQVLAMVLLAAATVHLRLSQPGVPAL